LGSVQGDGFSAPAPGAPASRKRRRPRHFSAGAAVPLVLGLVAGGFAYEALQNRSAMTEVVVARMPLRAGAALTLRDTRTVKVPAADRGVLAGLLGPGELREGWVTSVPVPAGEPLTASEIEKPASGPVLGEMSIAVPVEQAVGGSLAPGDLVDVIAGNGAGGSYYVAQGLRVVAVAPTSPAEGSLLGASTGYYVVVAVGKQAALRLAAAVASEGQGASGLQLVRSNGEAKTDRTSYLGPLKGSP